MAFTFLSCPHFLSPHQPHFLSLKPPPPRPPHRHRRVGHRAGRQVLPGPRRRRPAGGPGGLRPRRLEVRADRAPGRRQEDDFKKHQSTFLAAIADVEDPPENPSSLDDHNSGDDLFGEIDKAIALKRKEFVDQGLLKPNPKMVEEGLQGIDELEPEEVVDLEEIDKLQGLTVIAEEETELENFTENEDGDEVKETGGDSRGSDSSAFDLDFDSYGGRAGARIVEPKFRITLAELLDESKVVPVSVYGDLEVEITGIQHDSGVVSPGDLFVCCVGLQTDGHLHLNDADKRGAVAVVASKEIDIEDTLGCKALVTVEDTSTVLPALVAVFYRHPSRNMAVIGITGTNGKTTTTYLIKSMYEAMGLRTGARSRITFTGITNWSLPIPRPTPFWSRT